MNRSRYGWFGKVYTSMYWLRWLLFLGFYTFQGSHEGGFLVSALYGLASLWGFLAICLA